jgi:hypothetical protein
MINQHVVIIYIHSKIIRKTITFVGFFFYVDELISSGGGGQNFTKHASMYFKEKTRNSSGLLHGRRLKSLDVSSPADEQLEISSTSSNLYVILLLFIF